MKYIDFLVKKVLSESLNEKAEEITKKINTKSQFDEGECMEGDCGEMKEEWGSEDDFYEDEYESEESEKRDALKKKDKEGESKFKKAMERLRKKIHGMEEGKGTDVMSGEFDYVQEVELDEEELDEKLFGNQHRLDHNKNGRIDSKDLRIARAKKSKKETDEEVEEGNAFTGALAKAKEEGDDSFKVGDKEFKVQKESIKYSILINGENVILTENELITVIEEIVLEEKKNNLKSPGKSKGMVEFDRVHKKDEDINKKANEESFKKMKEYVKAGSKGTFETNPKHFPKGNGQLAKMDKKAYKASDAVDEYIDTFAYGGGMLDLDPDEIGYNEDWLEKTIEGSSMTGNSPEYANAEDTGYGKKLNKRRKENLYNQEKRQGSYNRVKQPVDVAGEKTKSGKLNKMFKNLGESTEEKEVLSEEMVRMKELLGYNKKTQ